MLHGRFAHKSSRRLALPASSVQKVEFGWRKWVSSKLFVIRIPQCLLFPPGRTEAG